MKTIRWKFVSVFVAATMAIMLIVFVLFNIAIRVYFERNARAEVKSSFGTMNVLVEKQLLAPLLTGNDKTVSETLVSLNSALTAARMPGNTELYIFDAQYQLKFPENKAATMLGEALETHIRNYDFEQKGHIERVWTSDGAYYLAGMTMNLPETGRLYIVFVSGMAIKHAAIGAMNVFLGSIMAVALAIGIISAIASAKSLTRPIKNVCRYAREIGNGNFITIPPDKSSLETSELIADINEMSARLKDADQAQKLLFQNASHELRTPLMSIQGYSEAISQGIVSDPKEAAAIIRAESIRLTALVEELMTLSKMDSNIFDRDFQTVDIAETITDCIDRLNGLALKEKKEIKPELIPGVMVRADETLLGEVFGNVVSNCLRYAKQTVSIRVEKSDQHVTVTVADDGDGFDPEDIPHLFNRFYKGKGGKFGLGLAIAKKATELLGGTIEAKNGHPGAVFTIGLPV